MPVGAASIVVIRVTVRANGAGGLAAED